jgi:hypothetical protein
MTCDSRIDLHPQSLLRTPQYAMSRRAGAYDALLGASSSIRVEIKVSFQLLTANGAT